jgi:hypothetical protein
MVAQIWPPYGYMHADVCKFVNQGNHVFVVWDNFTGGIGNLAALYTVPGGLKVWEQALTGGVSHNDRVWPASDGDEWFYLRTQNSLDELSKWDLTGRLWVSTRFQAQSDFRWCGGCKSDGSETYTLAVDTTSPPNARQFHVFDGAADVPGSSLDVTLVAGTSAMDMAVSGDGAYVGVLDHSGKYAIHDIAGDSNVASGDAIWQLQMAHDPAQTGAVACSSDGDEFLFVDEGPPYSVILYTAVKTTPVKTVLNLPQRPWTVAIAKDGSKAVVVTNDGTTFWPASGFNGWPTITVIDVPNKKIALDSNGVPIQYVVGAGPGTAHGHVPFMAVSDDGSEICWQHYGSGTSYTSTPNYPNLFRAGTTTSTYNEVATPALGYRCWYGDYDRSGGAHAAMAQYIAAAGPPHGHYGAGFVGLYELP